MHSLKKIVDRIINIPTVLICLVIVKLPFFNKYKIHLLSTWHDVEKRSKVDNLLFRVFLVIWIRFEYLKENNPDKRESLKSLAMGGESGKNWAKIYQSRPLDFNLKLGHMTFKDACPYFGEVETTLSNLNQKYIVVQIGCSSGREIRYFADMFPRHEYVGTDIYDEVTNFASSSNALPNLSFVVSSAKDIEKLLNRFDCQSTDKKFLIYSSGSLQYVQPEHLNIFFKTLAKYANLSLLLNEPGSESKGAPDKLKTSIYRGGFSYTHDYRWYAEKSGIETVKCEIIRPYWPYEDFPVQENTVHYFYYGRTTQNQLG